MTNLLSKTQNNKNEKTTLHPFTYDILSKKENIMTDWLTSDLLSQKQKDQMLKTYYDHEKKVTEADAQGKSDTISHLPIGTWPVVRFYVPDSDYQWLLSAINPHIPDDAWGVAYYGDGEPLEVYIELARLEEFKELAALVRDDDFVATKSLSDYAADLTTDKTSTD